MYFRELTVVLLLEYFGPIFFVSRGFCRFAIKSLAAK